MANCITDNRLRQGASYTNNTSFVLTMQRDSNDIPAIHTLSHCRCLQGYVSSVVSPRFRIRKRWEETGNWVCHYDSITDTYSWEWDTSGYKSWYDVVRDPYLVGTGIYPPLDPDDSVTDDSESESETSEGEFDNIGNRIRCKGYKYSDYAYLNYSIPADPWPGYPSDPVSPADIVASYPLGKLCHGDDTYFIRQRFACNRVMIWNSVYHDGVSYQLGEPDSVLRPCSNATPDAPREHPFLWRTCPDPTQKRMPYPDESDSDSSLSTESSESSLFDEDGKGALYFKRYVDGGNYQDIAINGQILLCNMARYLTGYAGFDNGTLDEYFRLVPAYCRHTLILNCSTYHYRVYKYDMPTHDWNGNGFGCGDDMSCRLPIPSERTSTLVHDGFLDCKAYAHVIFDGCHDFPPAAPESSDYEGE